MNTNDSTPKIYSYIRFSTPDQALGDSERRQLADVKRFAEKHSLPLDDTLRDRGVSGFHGDHRKKGALGRFLREVESGNIAPGSILCVENLDRLGREEIIEALTEVIFKIIKAGVTIQTLNPRETYTEDSINNNMIYGLIAHVQRANSESKRKSELVGAAWRNKKQLAQQGIIITKRAPAWLEIKDDRFIVKAGAAKTIRQIFNFKLKGLGKMAIARKLNASAAWSPSNGWRDSYITKLLSYRALIGEYQPYKGSHRQKNREPDGDRIIDYYPQIVKSDVFHAVQEQLKANRGKGGETGKASNLFTHIVTCAYCHGSMVYMNKGKGCRYLVCDKGRLGTRDDKGNPLCKSHSINYDEVETVVLSNCAGLRPEQILPDPDKQADEITMLQTKLSGIVGNIHDLDDRIANLTDTIESTKSKKVREGFSARIDEREKEIESLRTERIDTETDLESAERSRQSVKQWKLGLKNLRSSLKKGGVETRLAMRSHLKELIDKIEVFAVGFTKRSDGKMVEYQSKHTPRRRGKKRSTKGMTTYYRAEKDVENLVEYIVEIASELDPEQIKSKEFSEFCEWVTNRRMSKSGRFVRVHFNTKISRDIVPGDSIATGRGLEIDDDGGHGWVFVQPSYDKLWKSYKSWKRHH